MQPQIERYLDLANQGKNRWWRYLAGIVVIVVTSIVSTLSLVFLGAILKSSGAISPADAERYMRVLSGMEPDGSILAFVALNVSIIGMLAGLFLAMKFIHRRPLLTLVTPNAAIDWSRIAKGAAVGFVLLGALTLLEHLLFPGRYRLTFDATRFFPYMVAVLLLTPIQAATEELLFRGYMMQGLGLLTRHPAVIAIVSSLAFATVHLWNPEVARYGLPIMAASYFTSGLMLSTIALRDGRLELAIGMHAVNNVFTALVANNEGSVLQTQSIFMSPLDPVFSLIALLIVTIAFHWWVFDRATPKLAAPDAG